MINDLNRIKLAIFDKRIDSFINGYRQNIALFAHDEEEIARVLDDYFKQKTIPATKTVRVCAAHADRKMFFKNIVYSLLGNPLTGNLDRLIDEALAEIDFSELEGSRS